jgi:hypothetical protein
MPKSPDDYSHWLRCDFNDIGTMLLSSTPKSKWWLSDAGCIAGRAEGQGYAVWCVDTGENEICKYNNMLGVADGKINRGIFGTHVVLNTKLGRFSGKLNADGGYDSGILRKDNGEIFIGKFNPNGTYQGGALYSGDKIIVSNLYLNNRPHGKIMKGAADGSYSLEECNSKTGICRVIKQGNNTLLGGAFDAIKDVMVDRATTSARLALAKKLPFLRNPAAAFFFDVAVKMLENALENSSNESIQPNTNQNIWMNMNYG